MAKAIPFTSKRYNDSDKHPNLKGKKLIKDKPVRNNVSCRNGNLAVNLILG